MPPADEPHVLRDQLQSTLGASYSLGQELGGAGMSRVFIADEPRLGRRVVVKVLAPELAAGISADRFEREIRIVASLQQANIVPLISAGHTGGLPYYTMPFVDGRSLRDRLAVDGALPLADSVSILRDVARALAYAHDRGVIHRDVKPGNVLLSGGAAVVTDFGIAKALSAARTEDAATTLTATGVGIGTPAYMAPEQAAGDALADHRVDVYAFGCLAYEMLTGTPPFHGRSLQQIAVAHFREVPAPVTNLRAGVAPALAALVAKCLEKDAARRPQTAAELIRALDGVALAPAADTSRQRAIRRAGVALAVIVAVAGAAYFVRGGARLRAAAPLPRVVLAVLPFINVGGDSAQEYLADGIGDELTTALSNVAGVQITGRTAAQRYRGKRDIDSREVGRALGAKYVVQGTLRQANSRLAVSVQLADATTGDELWADKFERDAHDLASMKDSIVRAVRARLGVGPAAGEGAAAATAVNPEAYRLYLMGEYLVQRRGDGVAQSVDKFEKAIALDPRFARAYAGLASSLGLLVYYAGAPQAEVGPRATTAAQTAIALDSTLAEARVALGQMYWNSLRLEQAETEFRRAISFEPNNLPAHQTFGRFLLCLGRAREALAEFQRAREIDVTSAVAAAWTSYATFLTGGLSAALAESDRAMQLDSLLLPGLDFGAVVNLAAGRKDEVRRLIDRLPIANGEMSPAAYFYAAVGDTATAWKVIREREALTPRPWFVDADRALMLVALGDTTRALDALTRSAQQSGALWSQFMPSIDPAYDPLRGSARFTAILKSAGLDTRVLAAPRAGRPK